jgi:hypothetical protein
MPESQGNKMDAEATEDSAQRLVYAAWCEWQTRVAEALAAEQRYQEAATRCRLEMSRKR